MEKKLYRNEHDKVLAGVSSGLADYLDIDVTVVRLLFVLTVCFMLGLGLLIYIILWIVLPVNNNPSLRFSKFNEFYQQTTSNDPAFNASNAFNDPSNTDQQTKWNTPNAGQNFSNADFKAFPQQNDSSRTVVGLVLIVLGCFFLLKKVIIFPFWFSVYKLWPLIIVAIGISLIFKNKRKNEWEAFKKTTEAQQAAEKTEEATIVDEQQNNGTNQPQA